MTEETTGNRPGSGGEVRIERIYIKDLSFESPGAPEVFTEKWEPEMNVDINTRINPVSQTHYEVILTTTVRAKRAGGKTAFIAEVQQAGLFFLDGMTDEVRARVLGTICPSTLFPYLREAIDGLVVKGGFPALHLAPVNFDALYAQNLAQKRSSAPAGTTH